MSNVSKYPTDFPTMSLKTYCEDPLGAASGDKEGPYDLSFLDKVTQKHDPAAEIRRREYEAWKRKPTDYQRKVEGISDVLADLGRKADMSEFVRAVEELLRKQHAIRTSGEPRVSDLFYGAVFGNYRASNETPGGICSTTPRSRRLLLCPIR